LGRERKEKNLRQAYNLKSIKPMRSLGFLVGETYERLRSSHVYFQSAPSMYKA
jgi:hypothetical protein